LPPAPTAESDYIDLLYAVSSTDSACNRSSIRRPSRLSERITPEEPPKTETIDANKENPTV
jgi:hypothetical protein